MSEQIITWTTIPEELDLGVQWSVVDGEQDTLVYAWVAVDDTVLVAESSLDPRATGRETWNWVVETDYGLPLAMGDAQSEDQAKTDAARALLSTLSTHTAF